MRTAKPASADSQSQRRSQPVRQTRTNPARSSGSLARSTLARDESSGDQPIDIFPAITFFADTAAALPRELVRHFTLLREVDAKICAPEEQLFELVSAALETTHTEAHKNTASNAVVAPASAQNSARGTPLDNGAAAPTSDPLHPEQQLLRRRQLFRQISFKIQEMLVSLEEKNHVIGTANEALDKQIARIEDVWPYLEGEFSDEAKWGSTTHWAYPENRMGKAAHPERARRDGAAAISAAAQALADEAAARSDARKQALQAKKNLKNSHHDSDLDDHDHRPHKGEGKKSGQGKVRKTAEASGVGLGISGATNGNPPQKKRKVENATNGVGQVERAMSMVFGSSNASKAKAANGGETPAPEGQGPKKRKALPSGSSGQSKKRNGTTPSATSSPVLPSLPEPKNSIRGSPAPSNPPRPTTSRARGNSIQSLGDAAKNRPPSAASNKPNGTPSGNGEPPAAATAPPDTRSVKEPSLPVKGETKKDAERPETSGGAAPPSSGKKETKAEERERRKSESIPPGAPTPATVMTKSGRTSKPSTPALATFQEAARSRPSRNSDNGGRKTQKKGVAAAAQAAAVDEDVTSGEGEGDMDEPTYCYCNGVSYGAMVACDSDDCEREWFHLACVGLKVAPPEDRTWYCEDCKERLKMAGKKGNGR